MRKLAQGFTLVELLIVIAILGSLATITLISFSNQSGKARDVERKSDLRQYQAAIETYANRSNGVYPLQSSATNLTNLCDSTILNLTNCPDDPSGTTHYQYISDASGLNYILWAFLEFKPSNDVFVVCSGGEVGEVAGASFTTPTSANCPL